ncbi:MAG: hypothetical protein D6772_02670 [Bacteroidetes bacterium]|nr:MAG: hypothetical protein D6772_02670 [Bacteroidota bacterium]
MKILIGFFSFALLVVSQCQEQADYSFRLGEPFPLPVGPTYQAESADLQVGELVVIEDSRCPRGTTCVWEGQAVVQLMVNKQALRLTLQAGDPTLAVKTLGPYRFEAQKLEPYPTDASSSIDPAAYVLTLLVQRLP